MQFEQLKTSNGQTIDGPLLITPQAFIDDRGWALVSLEDKSCNVD